MSGTKDCKFCDKRGLLWLPLRYSAVGASSMAALNPLPKLSGKLGQGVADLALTHSKYAVRLLRPGYLYVLLERKGIKYWDAYRVLEDAFLYKFNPEEPPQVDVAFSCDRTVCGINASMVAIPEANDVPHVWSLFVPAPLTKAVLDDYKANADKYAGEGKLQSFSPAGWLQGKTSQPHTLLAPELLTKVAEYILFTQPGNPYGSDFGQALEQQLFPASTDAYAGTPPDDKGHYSGRLGTLFNTIKRVGYASFVLHDHIGIAQELNNFRNSALSPVEDFLAKREGEVDNQRRLDVMQALEDVHSGVKAHLIKLGKERVETADQMNLPNTQVSTAKELRAMGRIAEAEKVEAQIKEHERRKAKNRQQILDGTEAEARWNRIYNDLLSPNEIPNFKKALEGLSASCGKQANERAADHTLWVKSDRLVDAFDVFDPADQFSGFEFTREHMHCTHGMFGVDKNEAVLKEWMNIDKVERKNLYMRANLYNDKQLFTEASNAFAGMRQGALAAGGVAFMPPEKVAKLTKSFVDLQKKVDSAWDEWLRDEVVLEKHQGEGDKDGPKFIKKQQDLEKSFADENGKLSAQAKAQADAAVKKYRWRMAKLSKLQAKLGTAQMARMADWTRANWSRAGVLDHGLVAIAGTLVYPKLGKLTEEVGLIDYFKTISKEKLEALRKGTQAAVDRGLVSRGAADEYVSKNQPRTEAAAKAEAAKLAAAERAKVDGSIAQVLKNEQDNLHGKTAAAFDKLSEGDRPSTNNFRQMRMGAAMFLLEGFALMVKSAHHKGEWTARDYVELTASVSSLMSIACDFLYASVKSVREIDAYSKEAVPALNKSADIMRGGLKITAGLFSIVAGSITVGLDFLSARKEVKQDNSDWVLVGIYSARVGVGAFSTAFGLVAAFSYTGPMLKYLAGERFVLTRVAERVALARTLWLLRVARLNMVGMALTLAELIYACWKPDELEKWCKACTFRKDKKTGGFFDNVPYVDTKRELEELEKAFLVVTGQEVANSEAPKPLLTIHKSSAPDFFF